MILRWFLLCIMKWRSVIKPKYTLKKSELIIIQLRFINYFTPNNNGGVHVLVSEIVKYELLDCCFCILKYVFLHWYLQKYDCCKYWLKSLKCDLCLKVHLYDGMCDVDWLLYRSWWRWRRLLLCGLLSRAEWWSNSPGPGRVGMM